MSSDSLSPRPPLEPGLEGTLDASVRKEWTRAFHEPQYPAVFSTPAMIALMEGAISKTVAPALTEGTFTVGTRVEVDHLKAVPVGAPVSVSARLAEVKGRILIFDVEARSQGDVIGRGRIWNAIVDLARFERIASSSETPPPASK